MGELEAEQMEIEKSKVEWQYEIAILIIQILLGSDWLIANRLLKLTLPMSMSRVERARHR